MTNKIKKEFVFATHTKSKFGNDEVIVVKEHLHDNGLIRPNVRFVRNFQREFYITKPEFRNHESKKEYEYKVHLDQYFCTQSELPKAIFKVLNGYSPSGYVGLKDANSSPYVYGTDVSPTVLLANEYRKKYPNLSSPSTLAVLDYEADVINGTNDIISGVLCMNNIAHLAICKEFLGDLAPVAKKIINELIHEHLGEHLKNRNMSIEIDIVDKPSLAVKTLMKSAHKWSPDFIGVWNMNYDVPKMIETLSEDRIDPAFIFSDPKLPVEYHKCKYIKDDPIKRKANDSDEKEITANDLEIDVDSGDVNDEYTEEIKEQLDYIDSEDSAQEEDTDLEDVAPTKLALAGKVRQSPKHPADLWHTLEAPAGFYFVCLMATYKRVRAGMQLKNSYGLDAVLADELKLNKLKFKGLAEGLTGLAWHKQMQKHHKLEYMVYMFWDALSCIILDEKTKDVSIRLKAYAGISDIYKISSNPKLLIDDLHFVIGDDKVIGSTSSNMTEPLDKYIPSLKRWIIALPSDLEFRLGNNLINEYPLVQTNISILAWDTDVKSAYPTGEVIGNVSKGTTKYELCKIPRFTEVQQRSVGIHLTGIKPNAVLLAQLCFNFPKLDNALVDEFLAFCE